MLEYKNIPIRLVSDIKLKDPTGMLLKAFKSAKNKPIPIYYQYAQSKNVTQLPTDNIIGYTKAIKIISEEIVCDVEIHNLLKLASNFDGVIDNYTMKIMSDQSYQLDRLIIYDRELKRKVMEKIMADIKNNETQENQEMSVCMEIAAAESIPELKQEAPKAN